MDINPKSVAGILLREHDTPEQALAYAERKSKLPGGLYGEFACDYVDAARQLRAYVADRAACPVTANA